MGSMGGIDGDAVAHATAPVVAHRCRYHRRHQHVVAGDRGQVHRDDGQPGGDRGEAGAQRRQIRHAAALLSIITVGDVAGAMINRSNPSRSGGGSGWRRMDCGAPTWAYADPYTHISVSRISNPASSIAHVMRCAVWMPQKHSM
jgi:hypothetical protein